MRASGGRSQPADGPLADELSGPRGEPSDRGGRQDQGGVERDVVALSATEMESSRAPRGQARSKLGCERLEFSGEGREEGPRVVRERLADGRMVMPVRERPKEVLLPVMVEVYWPPGPNVLEVEDDVEGLGCSLQELQDLVPGRPCDRDVLASDANDQMGTPQLFPRHPSQPSD
jgi:hypothetical protein